MPRDINCSEDVDMGADRVESDREQKLAEKLIKSAGQAENKTRSTTLKVPEPLPRIEPPRRDSRADQSAKIASSSG